MLQKIKKFLDRLTFLRSLRVIFFIFIFLVGVIPCILLQNGILDSYEQRAVEVREEQVKGQLRSVANHLISSNYLVNQEFRRRIRSLNPFVYTFSISACCWIPMEYRKTRRSSLRM